MTPSLIKLDQGLIYAIPDTNSTRFPEEHIPHVQYSLVPRPLMKGERSGHYRQVFVDTAGMSAEPIRLQSV